MTVVAKPEKLVLLGMMSRRPVGGQVWMTLHYLIGLRRLGYDVYYVEAHGCTPGEFMRTDRDDGWSKAAGFIDRVMRRFDMGDRWAFHARHASGRFYGLSESRVKELYRSASAIFNLHGGTVPAPEHSASGRLVFLDTDPVDVQIEVHDGVDATLKYLEPHSAFFTFAENYGRPDCKLPVSDRFPFKPTRQPVVLDLWDSRDQDDGLAFTTIGNWRQHQRVIVYQGEEYHWSKHLEFLKFLDLPRRTRQEFELALSGSSFDAEDRALLENNGWRVRDALGFSYDLDTYRRYITGSRGEFTVAKDQNIRLRTGWFSERSVTYLASSRPVITQETGFSNVLPAGEGLIAFSTTEEIVAAVEAINRDYQRHRRAALGVARECFSHDVVLPRMLSELGISRPAGMKRRGPTPDARLRRSGSGQSFGVNVVGLLSSGTGMGAQVRGYRAALERLGVPVALIDVSDLSESGRAVVSGANDVNLVCCDVASHFAVWSHLGAEFFRGRYNIGLWSWELPSFPEKWLDRFCYYDEIWAPTAFVASAIAPVSPVPVVRIPEVVETEAQGCRERGRQRLGVSPDEFTYLFIFNFHSRFQRKNPAAAIESFKAAFQPGEPARLIIKCTNADFRPDPFSEMCTQAEGHRISILDGQWTPQEMLDLMAACDCYLSLHRAEGVGLTICDAMAAGKPVVATGWSGNMDFMSVSNSFPVRYQLVPLDRDVGHYRAGELWAEPSQEHAAEMLRYVFDHCDEAALRGQIAKLDIAAGYSSSAVGEILARRLTVIRGRRRFRSLRRLLHAPVSDLEQFLAQFSELGTYVPENHLRNAEMKSRLQAVVRKCVPPSATLMIVSKGDDELLRIHEPLAWHFPQDEGFKYAGHHPRDSAEAILHLEMLRERGGEFLLVPSTSFWWLDHYAEFRDHLQDRYQLVHRDQSCLIFELSRRDHPSVVAASA
jgi:hypothetical protein